MPISPPHSFPTLATSYLYDAKLQSTPLCLAAFHFRTRHGYPIIISINIQYSQSLCPLFFTSSSRRLMRGCSFPCLSPLGSDFYQRGNGRPKIRCQAQFTGSRLCC